MKAFRFAAAVLVAALVAVPLFAQRGSADFTTFVALGDSYGAGVSSGSLNERHQVWSWPAVIARQAGLTLCPPNAIATDHCWAQPLVTYPGIGPEYILQSLTVGPVPGSGQGVPVMTTFGRPYNNLSVPGATVGALLAVTGAEPQGPNDPTPVVFGRFILRGQGNAVAQAAALHPTFIAMWIGGNDFLGSVLSGTDKALTSAADFKTRYEAVLDQLIAAAPNAGMVVGNLPSGAGALGAPVISFVPPVLVDPATRQPVLINGQPFFFIADLGGGNVAQLPPGSFVLLTALGKLRTGFGLPAAFAADPRFAGLPNLGKPLADSDVLTPTEMNAIFARVAEYNTIIQNAASARNIPVADIAGLFNRVAATGGLHIGPFAITKDFVQGGFFSYDGFHLTDLGYLLFANEYIRTINNAYDTEIPVASITQLFADNGAFFPDPAANANALILSDEAVAQLMQYAIKPPIRKMRSINH